MNSSRQTAGTALLATLMGVVVAACGGTGQATTSAATRPALGTVAPSASSGPTGFTSTAFDQPFTITLPAGWTVGDQVADMASFYLPIGPGQGPRLGIDVQEVSKVFKDPCDTASVEIDAGTSSDDLATWMGTWTPLHASKPVAATVSGRPAITVDEAFDGTPCSNANLWPTSGGFLDSAEHKRYAILEVGGKRVVVTLVGRDDMWDSTLADGQKVLDSLAFTNS